MEILIIEANPKSESLCKSIALKYAEGAAAASHKVHTMHLSEVEFAKDTFAKSLEPDLLAAQMRVKNADHIVWVYPIYWGTMPSIMKAFIERVFASGFAYKYHGGDSPWWDKLLQGKTSSLIQTMDSPTWWNYWVYRNVVVRTLRTAILWYCGIKLTHWTSYGQMRFVTPEKVERILKEVYTLGSKVK